MSKKVNIVLKNSIAFERRVEDRDGIEHVVISGRYDGRYRQYIYAKTDQNMSDAYYDLLDEVARNTITHSIERAIIQKTK